MIKHANLSGTDMTRNKQEIEVEYRRQIVWFNVVGFAILHLAALYGAYLSIFSGRLYTLIFAWTLYIWGGIGVTAGAHRLWSHRSYKATRQFEVLLVLLNSSAGQNSVIEWVRDHRVHHKYSETDADPHNAKRGFFFAHIGWLLCKKHPDVINKGKGVDISDVERNRILVFQRDHYISMVLLFCFVIPTLLPVYLWGESWRNAFFIAAIFRYVTLLNAAWLVNSAAHLFGDKPYDKSINPSENRLVSFLTRGEGNHNYHHAFPWDYKAAELGSIGVNTTHIINLFASIGWAYDLKVVSPDYVRDRVAKVGDGTHRLWGRSVDTNHQEANNADIFPHSCNMNGESRESRGL